MQPYKIVEGAFLYFLTFSVVDWLPVFMSAQSCEIFTSSLNFCHETKHLRINAYVIMTSHVHLIVFDEDFDSNRLKKTLADLRKYTGRKMIEYSIACLSSCFTDVFQHSAGKDRAYRFWQAYTHPEAIYTQKFWQQKIDYIHENPVRKGLVTEASAWRFSSAAAWLENGTSDVFLSAVTW